MPPQEVARVVQALRPELRPGGSSVKPAAPRFSAVAVQTKPNSQRPAYTQQQLASSQQQPTYSQPHVALKPILVAERPKIAHATPSQEARTWTSGKYTAEARFVSLDGDTVRLQRTSGVNTKIPFEKLSAEDQHWIRQYVSTPPLTAGIPPIEQD
jgi:hypothetical protein